MSEMSELEIEHAECCMICGFELSNVRLEIDMEVESCALCLESMTYHCWFAISAKFEYYDLSLKSLNQTLKKVLKSNDTTLKKVLDMVELRKITECHSIPSPNKNGLSFPIKIPSPEKEKKVYCAIIDEEPYSSGLSSVGRRAHAADVQECKLEHTIIQVGSGYTPPTRQGHITDIWQDVDPMCYLCGMNRAVVECKKCHFKVCDCTGNTRYCGYCPGLEELHKI